jgi:putative ABC transport system substrate-binding protein
MDRRRFLLSSLAGAVGAPLAAGAQPADRPARLGYLLASLTGSDPRFRQAFLQGLRDLGHVEGKNLLIEYRDADGRPERFPVLAGELVALKVDVIVAAGGTLAAMAAKQATATIPVVFPSVGDPVAEGLVGSLARPGGNVTGLAVVSPELIGKSLELLKQALPAASRLALLIKPDSVTERVLKARLTAADTAARALGARLQVVEARSPEDFERAFSEMTRGRADAVTVASTPVFDNARRPLVGLAARHRLPAMYSFKYYVDDGGLMSYGPDVIDLFRRAAGYVDRILKGARPGDLPVEQPTKFDLVVNLKTARTLGLTLPPSFLLRADQVIE